MREDAEKRIGHLYPKIEVTPEVAEARPDLRPLSGQHLTVVAWLWARTVKSPNPAFLGIDVPLVSTFMLSTKPGKQVYVEPLVENKGYRFMVKAGAPRDSEAAKNGTKAPGRGAAFVCVMSGTPISGDYIKAQGQAGRMGARLMAIVAEGTRGRVYLSPTSAQENVASEAQPRWRPSGSVPPRLTGGTCVPYGLKEWGDLFTSRQLVALTTFSDLIGAARERIKGDAIKAGLPDDATPLNSGGSGAQAYADAIAVYLAFALDKLADRGSTICTWFTERDSTRNTFARQSIPMTWDFAELNTLLDGTGSFNGAVEWTAESIEHLAVTNPLGTSDAAQVDAQSQHTGTGKVVSTDPPYYDNIGYGDLSDFFYVWLRRSLRSVFPELFTTVATPKAEELVATAYRHGSRDAAERFFLTGMTEAMQRLAENSHPDFPTSIYYAFKQSETDDVDGKVRTGWETFLEAVIRAGFDISGTWPMRTELGNRMLGRGTNALASSIVLVCRPRFADAPVSTRREFLNILKSELPLALARLQHENIAPVDLAQAAIGPGMAVFTRYSKVLDADGCRLAVRDALNLINEVLDEVLAEQEGDFDPETRFAISWFDQMGFQDGDFGVADVPRSREELVVSRD